jgi:hypothetical protein
VDQADVLLMQNWDHVEKIFEKMNLLPRESHGTDFSRVHNWQLNAWHAPLLSAIRNNQLVANTHGRGKYYRQTLIFSAFQSIEMNALFNRHCFSIITAFHCILWAIRAVLPWAPPSFPPSRLGKITMEKSKCGQ